MSVTLRKRTNANGTSSFRLDIIYNGKRWYEPLKNIKQVKVSNHSDRQVNKENLDMAKKIAIKRAQELVADEFSILTDSAKKTDVVDWIQQYVDKYTKKDKRNMQGVLNRFINFLKLHNLTGLAMKGLNEDLITDFRDYLNTLSVGEGGASYFARFKKMIKYAHRKKLLYDNPAAYVEVKGVGNARKKDILTLQEIQLLAQTPIQSDEIKRAFLFSCFTGLRWIDIKALKWMNINIANFNMDVRQSKTEKNVNVNLNKNAMKLLGDAGMRDELIFNLPSANGANKTLKAWIKRAKIEKEITWHNARHSFGTNLIFNDVDILTTSKLMGHSSLKPTQRYVKVSEEMKRKAVDVLNIDI